MSDAQDEYTLSENLQKVLSNTLKAPHWNTASDHLATPDPMGDPRVKALVEAAKVVARALDELTSDDWDGDYDFRKARVALHSLRAAIEAARGE